MEGDSSSFLLLEDKPVALLPEFNLAQCAHAQQNDPVIHARIDAGSNIAQVDITYLDVVDLGSVNGDYAVGGAGVLPLAAW